MEFPTPTEGLASPVLRSNPGFVGGGRTAEGTREFVIPNDPFPLSRSIDLRRPKDAYSDSHLSRPPTPIHHDAADRACGDARSEAAKRQSSRIAGTTQQPSPQPRRDARLLAFCVLRTHAALRTSTIGKCTAPS